MNIDIKDIITLDNNKEYVVVSKTNYENKTYYFLVDINDNNNIKFCYEKGSNNALIETENADLIKELLPIFVESAKGHIPEIDFSKFNGTD